MRARGVIGKILLLKEFSMKLLRQIAVGILILLVFSGCIPIFVTPDGRVVSVDTNLNNVVTVFEPSRGQGATYRQGEAIAFNVYALQDGYLTLTALEPNGDVYVFSRNIFIRGGESVFLAGPDSRHTFGIETDAPRGIHRVRASFTSNSTDVNIVTYSNVIGDDGWTQSIRADISPYSVRDVVETSFFVQ
jgi:hypothetical protein